MADKVKPIPEGCHSVIPYLTVKDPVAALKFYEVAFGGEEVCRMVCPQTGTIMHAETRLGDSLVYIGGECLEYGAKSAETLGGTPVTVHLYVEDADATVARAAEFGARVEMPVTEMFWGDRFGKLVDPFGHKWSIATHVEDVPPEEMHDRMMKWMAANAPAREPAEAVA